ncbi:MAG TPA: M13 family metallopeptidase [Thermoanaerobaculia bacterium]|jgi:predicted metalloendopeptidase
MRTRLAIATLFLAACTTTAPKPTTTPTTSKTLRPATLTYDRTALDPATSACTDFYQYSNGGWLARNPIPPQYTSWGYGTMLNEENRLFIRQVLESAAANPRTPNEQKIGAYYASCMDVAAIDAAGLSPLRPELDRIDAIANRRDLQAVFARLQERGIGVPFTYYSSPDAKNSSSMISEVSQAGLGLPDRDYYFKDDARSQEIRAEYVKHVARMLELAGSDTANAARDANTIMKLETALAEASMTRVQMRDPNAIYNKRTLAQLASEAPSIDWNAYFAARGANVAEVNVAQPQFVAAVSRLMNETPVEDWKAYLRWQVLTNTAGSLPTPIEQENFRFRSAFLQGQKQQQERWQRCVARTNNQLGEALGQAFVDRKFPPAAKQRATELVNNLVLALEQRINSLDRLSDATRAQSLTKLGTFTRKIGYPDTWRDYSSARIVRGPYTSNVLAANVFESKRDLAKIGKPIDRGEWFMSPQTINAYYYAAMNEIVFPAAILQWPYFDIEQDDAFNYGAIGSIIGHELSHGFDDEGSQYDERGNLRNWWTEEDRKKFEAQAECIVKQFDAYEVEPGVAHNGKLVAGESIADLGGLVIAYEGWKKSLEGKPQPPVIDGFTPEQRFFLGYSRARATNATPEALRMRLATDPHPANKFRVNGPLANYPPFAQAFQCKAADAMVRGNICEIW